MPTTNKPILEKLSPNFGSSILVRQHTKKRAAKFKKWHFHPEIELVYVNKGKGKRHIGNHLSYFNNSQLILIGANLPHNGFTDRLTAKGIETIVQFSPDLLTEKMLGLPEMNGIKLLLERAKKGLLFKPETKMLVGPRIEKLAQTEGINRFAKLLRILDLLSKAEDYALLNADGYAFEAQKQDSDKIDSIYKYVNKYFQEHIALEDIANNVSMTVPAFCRYFKKVTGKTFTQLVNEVRIVHATKLLSESKSSITDICFECGFNNFSHFNKQFKEFTGKSASNYRKEIKLIIQASLD
ncbi:AraC family transcriptional regulator [Flavobacteriaceae bacterium F08102]|nr:AraC family transcriptional regulator [Flavobacteriaceae bacterium F08102]